MTPLTVLGQAHELIVGWMSWGSKGRAHSSAYGDVQVLPFRGISAGITESQLSTEACSADTTTGSAEGLCTQLAARYGKPRRVGLDSTSRACGAGPYYFPWPNVGFFCQQHKHLAPVGHPGPPGYDDTQDCCCTIQ
ncbi:hypothetical protein ACK3TF_001722 [Chlorella vulgaris]